MKSEVKLDHADAQALLDCVQKRKAVGEFVQAVTRQGQHMVSELMEQERAVWERLDKKYGLDLRKVDYSMTEDGTALRPVTVRVG